MKQIQLVLVGIGGYANMYVEELIKNELQGACVSAVVDPMAAEAPNGPALSAAGTPVFESVSAFLAAGIHADLGIVSSPIAFHAEQSCALLQAGINVLCEKPMAATPEDAEKMRAARDASGRFLEIGYQWSFSEAIQSLKRDILAGRFGVPRRFSTWVAWARTHAYYSRTAWAGCQYDKQGRAVFDSPANNATAHYLHNMLFLLAARMSESVQPVALTAECYRANAIANFDAVCCRIETPQDVEVLFYSAHCVDVHRDPVCRFEFEEAVVTIAGEGGVVARFSDGSEIRYGDPQANHMLKLERCINHVRSGRGITEVCGPEAALAHVQCIAAMQEVPIYEFPASQIRQILWEDSEMLTYVPELSKAMRSGFEQGRLFSEMNLPWASPAKRVVLPGAYSDAGDPPA